ncbi:hypothetical protein [Novosphingobium rosa]|uniref:hypothetical protein n=1 Tax=Novosphingobium rosa TaxID=76978 RepID=UPI00082CC689|nr:hypothetical protein [Novosphingobium rosa]
MPISFTASADTIDPTAPAIHLLQPGAATEVARQARSLRPQSKRQGHSPGIALTIRPVMAAHKDAGQKSGPTMLQRLGLAPRKALVAPAGDAVNLVGTLDQVVEAVLAYYDIGVDHIILRGSDPLESALIALVQRRVVRRDAVLGVLAG